MLRGDIFDSDWLCGDGVWTRVSLVLYLVDDVGISGESVQDLSQRGDIKEPEENNIPSKPQRCVSALRRSRGVHGKQTSIRAGGGAT